MKNEVDFSLRRLWELFRRLRGRGLPQFHCLPLFRPLDKLLFQLFLSAIM
jgi:hypothetical protein